MPSCAITKRTVDTATPRTDKPNSDLYLWDSGRGSVSGFGLKVTPAGSKIFVLQYRPRGSRADRRYRIGKYGDWTPDQAREQARKLRRIIDTGGDPFELDRQEGERRTAEFLKGLHGAFSEVSENWLASYSHHNGRARSVASLKAAKLAAAKLRAEFGAQRIDEISRAQLAAFFDSVPPEKVATRRSLYSYSRILWKWAAARDLIDENPFDRLPPPDSAPSRDRYLSDEEIAVLWAASQRMSYPFGPIVRLLVLTGQRRSEVMGMSWTELHRRERVWIIPAARAKNRAAHIVPLAPAVILELDALSTSAEWPNAGLVFTVTGKTPVSGISKAKARLDREIAQVASIAERPPIAHWRLHDLRRTVATGLQRLGIRFEVTESVLNHVSGARAGVAGVYQRHDWACLLYTSPSPRD